MPEDMPELSVNSLDEASRKKYGKCFYKKYLKYMRKHFGFWSTARLTGAWYTCPCTCMSIYLLPEQLSETTLCFSNAPIRVPSTLHLLANSLLLNQDLPSGIFRVNSTKMQLESLSNTIDKQIETSEALDMDAVVENNSRYTTIDIAEGYKKYLRSFNISIIPDNLMSIVQRFKGIGDEEEKLSCLRSFLFYMPSTNASILEHNGALCRQLLNATKGGRQQLDFDGIATIMMPCFFFQGNRVPAADTDMLGLIEFTKYLLTNIDKAVRLDAYVHSG